MAEQNGHIVIQMLEVTQGQKFHLDLTPGTWIARWIDPSSGQEISRTSFASESELPEFIIPVDSDHLVLHLHP